MSPDIAVVYALRRKSDGSYYKKTKPPPYRSQRKTCRKDKLSHWTPEASEATFYTLRGAKCILGQRIKYARDEQVERLRAFNHNSNKDLPALEEYEIVRFVCTEQPEVI